MNDDANLAQAMRASTELLQAEQYEEALELLENALNAATKAGEKGSWIPTVCNHAAVIADFAGRDDLIKRYYERSLAYDEENPRALYGLAKVFLEQGDAQLAKAYATKCHAVVMRRADRKGRGLLDLISKRWPELSPHS
jgi:Tfp pilus assembly protein PilF